RYAGSSTDPASSGSALTSGNGVVRQTISSWLRRLLGLIRIICLPAETIFRHLVTAVDTYVLTERPGAENFDEVLGPDYFFLEQDVGHLVQLDPLFLEELTCPGAYFFYDRPSLFVNQTGGNIRVGLIKNGALVRTT